MMKLVVDWGFGGVLGIGCGVGVGVGLIGMDYNLMLIFYLILLVMNC